MDTGPTLNVEASRPQRCGCAALFCEVIGL
jgi:hypothetical protein